MVKLKIEKEKQMINRIYITKLATFQETNIDFANKKVTFVFGSNGTGKTTISKILQQCASDMPLAEGVQVFGDGSKNIRVFNKDFVNEHFTDEAILDGIFTFGEDSADKQEQVTRLIKEIATTKENLQGLTSEKERKETEDLNARNKAIDETWNLYPKYSQFKDILDIKRKKTDFFEFCQKLSKPKKDEKNVAFSELETDFKTYLKYKDIEHKDEIPLLKNFIISSEESLLLSEPLKSSSSSQMKKFFDSLNNIDWVGMGLSYLDESKDHCPFCGQEIKPAKVDEIKSIFDKEYDNQKSKILTIKNKISEYLHLLKNEEVKVDVFDDDRKQNYLDALKALEDNVNSAFLLIERKYDAPSKNCILPDFTLGIDKVNKIIDDQNKDINRRNKISEEKIVIREQLKENIKKSLAFDFYSSNNKAFLGKHQSYLNDLKKLDSDISEANKQLKIKQKNISDLNNSMTNITNTVIFINEILAKFGFTGFYLKETSDQKHYQILRTESDNPVKDTLSEGEKEFVCFLYFYYSLSGSFDRDKVGDVPTVYIDDPVSSLDSNIMFIVSSLIDDLMLQYVDHKIEQLIVTTHNVYFLQKLENGRNNIAKFDKKEFGYLYLIKKKNITFVKNMDDCPVKSSYAVLWDIIKHAENYDYPVVFNSMRRILDEYFEFIGGMNYSSLIKQATDPKEKIILNSLTNSINSGSHLISDDFNYVTSEENLDVLKSAFHHIFIYLKQEEHYKMMIQD